MGKLEELPTGALIKILSETLSQRGNADCREFNLTMQQMRIMHFLKEREEEGIPTSQKDIQNCLRVSHPTICNILRLLEEKNFVRIRVSPEDGRVKLVSLTGMEEAKVKEMIRRRERMEVQMVKGLTKEDQERFRRYLLQVYQNVLDFPGNNE